MELNGVADLPEIRPATTSPTSSRIGPLEPGDVLTVASTIVSKAEGRTANLEDYPVSGRAEEIADRIAKLADEEKGPAIRAGGPRGEHGTADRRPILADRDPVRPHLRQCGDRPLERAGSRPVTPAEATDRERRADSSGLERRASRTSR